MSGSLFLDSFRMRRQDGGKLNQSLILCYVTLASNQVFQVEVDHKADGKEVINKVSLCFFYF